MTHSHFAPVNTISLHYTREGEGELMLFLHGFPEYGGIWHKQLAHFKNHYTVVAPDLRGFNLSSQPSDPAQYKIPVLMEDIRQLIDYLGFKSCILVAHDWGGAVAWNFAIKHPEYVSKLVILNAPHNVPFARELASNKAQIEASTYMMWLRAPEAETLLAQNNYKKLFNFFSHSSAMLAMNEAEKDAYREVWARGLTGGLNYYRASPLMPVGENIKPVVLDKEKFKITMPTLVLWGMKDKALLPCLLEGLEEVVPQLTLEKFENATHWLIHEEPDRVNAAIDRFLAA